MKFCANTCATTCAKTFAKTCAKTGAKTARKNRRRAKKIAGPNHRRKLTKTHGKKIRAVFPHASKKFPQFSRTPVSCIFHCFPRKIPAVFPQMSRSFPAPRFPLPSLPARPLARDPWPIPAAHMPSPPTMQVPDRQGSVAPGACKLTFGNMRWWRLTTL